jgi:hypothetical protein
LRLSVRSIETEMQIDHVNVQPEIQLVPRG